MLPHIFSLDPLSYSLTGGPPLALKFFRRPSPPPPPIINVKSLNIKFSLLIDELTLYIQQVFVTFHIAQGLWHIPPIFIDREAREIMYLVVSVRPSVCPTSHG